MSLSFGRYQLLRKIASGGMGQVLLAKKGNDGFEKLVVLKRILPHLVEDEEFFDMFLDEARLTMRLDHPNIARINEFGEENGIHYIEMEYIAGEDLRRMDKRSRATGTPIPLGVVLRVIADAAAGLDFAHKAKDPKGAPMNLVHRDVSPQNVLVGFDGAVKLIDFGVAKALGRAQHTATGILKGKFPYMSPEQADGRDLDARSDIFALGIVLWELLVGRRLFKGENDLQTQRLVRACQVPAPSTLVEGMSEELDEIVLKALAKNREHRYRDAQQFRMALEDFALSHRIPASSAHLVSFMHTLYAERIAKEATPSFMEETSGLSGLDFGAPSGRSSVADNGTPSARLSTGTRAKALEQTPQSNSRGIIIGAVAALLLVALGAGAFIAGGGGKTTTTVIEPPKPVRIDPPKPQIVEPPKPQEPQRLSVTVNSDPTGAELELAGVRMGQTPMEVRVELAKLPADVKLTKDGFEPASATITDATGSTLTLQLKKKARVGVTAPPPKDPGPGPGIKTTR